MKLELSRQIFKNYSNIFHEHPSSGGRVVSWGKIGRRTERLTDRHDEANSHHSQFFERA